MSDQVLYAIKPVDGQYGVINVESGAVQSVWKSCKEALAVCKSLNSMVNKCCTLS